ncbi:MAG: ABC transporter ATP-binding protein [Deltaproteobacteria bacterium]|nr:MAG: ABC transporter ATP-binding protein [Deltaproteobacteria bacterium]
MSRHPLLRLFPQFRGSELRLAWGMAGLGVASAATLASPWLVAQAIDVDIANGDVAGLTRRALLYVSLLGVSLTMTWASRVTLEVVAQRAMYDLKRQLFAHLVGHDLAFHDDHPSGSLITRVQGDTEALRVLFAEVVLMVPADGLLFFGMFGMLAWTSPALLPIVFGVVPVYLVLFWLFRKIGAPYFLKARAVKATLTAFLAEHVRAMPILQTFDREQWTRDRAAAINEEVFRAEALAQVQPVWYFNSVMLAQRGAMVATLLVGGALVSAGEVTLGALVMGIGYLRLMFQPLMRLSHQLSTLERARAAALRVAGILDSQPTIADPVEPVPWPGLTAALRLEEVGFSYVEGTPILRGIDLAFPAGTSTGIVGATGAGKSTVLNLLFRFRDPTSGRVSVDGVDLRDLALGELRRRIGLVQQDVHLFPGTVLDNLGGDRERAERALSRVGLSMDLDQDLLDGGANLSRGERQLLTFARALVDDPEVLVLDEATSAIDPETERTVQAALDRLKTGRTTITVAHRLATVRDCDQIYVLAHGEVQEVGTHDELLARGGLYAALAQLQGVAA